MVSQLKQKWYELNSISTEGMSPRDIGFHVGQKAGILYAINLFTGNSDTFKDISTQLHDIARGQNDIRIDNQLRNIADTLYKAGKDMSDKGYELSTHEKQAEFARKRNYPL